MKFIMSILRWFMVDDPVKGINHPRDQVQLKVLEFSFRFQNAWPGRELGEEQKCRYVAHAFHVFINICGVLSCAIYLVLSDTESFYEFGHLLIVFLIFLFVTVCRILFTFSQNGKIAQVGVRFLNEIHLFYYKDGSEYAMKTFKQIHVICHYFVWYILFQTYVGHLFFNLGPIWNNYSAGKYKERNLANRTYEHSVYLYYPERFDVLQDYNTYIVGAIIGWFMTLMCATLFCTLDILLSMTVFHIWGHLKLLLYDLANFPLPADKKILKLNGVNETVSAAMYSEEELVIVSEKLKECIRYHRMIKEFTDEVSDAFGPMLFFLYAFLQSSGCLLFLECSQMTMPAFFRYFPVLCIIFQHLIQVSVIFELIGSTSEKLKDAVYGVPWEHMDTKNRSTVGIFMYFVQEPIHVKALGVINVGVTTMATVIKTSVSYFTLLRSMGSS